DQLKSAWHEADSKASLVRTCGLCPCLRLKRPVDTMELNSQTDSKASLAMPTVRTCGLCPCVRLKRPVDAMELNSQPMTHDMQDSVRPIANDSRVARRRYPDCVARWGRSRVRSLEDCLTLPSR